MWQCPLCETRNDDSSTICVVCGTNKSILHNLHDTPTETERQDNVSREPIIQKNIESNADLHCHDVDRKTSHGWYPSYPPLPDASKLVTSRSSRYGKIMLLGLGVAFMLALVLYIGFVYFG